MTCLGEGWQGPGSRLDEGIVDGAAESWPQIAGLGFGRGRHRVWNLGGGEDGNKLLLGIVGKVEVGSGGLS